jgi:hypothetical protein
LRRGRPAAPNSHPATKASFILKHQPDVTPFDHVGAERGLQRFGSFFPTPLERRGRSWDVVCLGPPFRQPCRARSR